jgi:hypothetical protein
MQFALLTTKDSALDTYPYELLDGRRFQQLAQSLLVREYPDIQCMPLSGPDGGRDAIRLRRAEVEADSRLSDAVVFQVKFREPQLLGTPSSDDLYDWFERAITSELAKIAVLKERGARQYCVITNVPSTGHLSTGLRDRVQEFLANRIDLPASCWWREDLDARLASQFDLVVHYGLFKGPESLRAVLEGVLAGSQRAGGEGIVTRSSRDPAVTALLMYLDAQYREDDRLRFKQADLPASPLLEFFIDVPVEVMMQEARHRLTAVFDEVAQAQAMEASREDTPEARVDTSTTEAQRETDGDLSMADDMDVDIEDADALFEEGFYSYANPGGADLLLTERAAHMMGRAVIEGAPGQGKSTLGQYICQVHRIRLLRKDSDAKRLPKRHLKTPLRLPFRVELRHLATYLRGRSPWERAGDRTTTTSPQDWTATLESFLAAAIRHAAGGLACTQDDVVAILAGTPTLIVLDGLDEVVDIDDRVHLVSVVQESLNRLSALGVNHQVVVTSRPAAFVKAPAFSRKDFTYLVLRDLPRKLIDDYAERWIEIRDIPADQADDFRNILKGSLDRAHVADLARNPMQLAILLWLIYVRGWSLPDKRTALYEAYMDTFLNREAEKSPVVRQHREVLLELHGYLGWTLHARSEAGQHRAGDIEEPELRTVLKDYLIREERPPELIDDLFKGVERMYVLVSRIEGRFEFEVQPLREFFAARHLYKTSPHSTSAAPALGSRPDRLEALIRNPYWFNVARFFCGWYDKGELADLTRRLEDLCNDSDYALLGHPRVLIARLLRDYVTTASRRDTRALATAMLDDLGLRLALVDGEHSRRSRELGQQPPVLPPDAGLDTLLDSVQSRLLTVQNEEQLHEWARVLTHPDLQSARIAWWSAHLPNMQETPEFSRWLRVGVLTGTLPQLKSEQAIEIFSPSNCLEADWWRCVESDRSDVAGFDTERLEAVTDAIASGARTRFHEYGGTSSWLNRLTRALWSTRFFNLRRGHTAFVMFRRTPNVNPSRDLPPDSAVAASVGELRRLTARITNVVKSTDRGMWHRSLDPYDAICRLITETLGECWVAWRIALIGATVHGSESGAKDGDLLAKNQTMVARARAARLASTDREYWIRNIEAAANRHDRLAVAASCLAWAHTDLWPELFHVLTKWWNELEDHELAELHAFVPRLVNINQSGRRRPADIGPDTIMDFDGSVPDSLLRYLLLRISKAQRDLVVGRVETAPSPPHHQPSVSADLLAYYLWVLKKDGNWAKVSSSIIKHYGRANIGPDLVMDAPASQDFEGRVARSAKEVLGSPMSYPSVLVRAADRAASTRVVRRLPPLVDIAQHDRWFFSE